MIARNKVTNSQKAEGFYFKKENHIILRALFLLRLKVVNIFSTEFFFYSCLI